MADQPSRIRETAVAMLVVSVLYAGSTDPAAARPLYAMRTGMACARCHVDPAGGGVRTATGFMYALNGHKIVAAEERTATIKPEISDGLRIGGDFRTMYQQQYIQDVSGDRSSFFMMQSAFYLAAQLIERVTLVYANDRGDTREAFALIGGFPMQGTVKVGRFRPAFGIEEEDHTTFTRDPLGFGNESEEQGVEFSVALGQYAGNLAVVNGNRGSTLFDDNAQKGVIYRGRYMTDRYGLGLNGYYNNPGTTDGGGKRRYLYGLFGNLHSGPFVLMGEYDRGANEYEKDDPQNPRTKVELAAAFVELSCLASDRNAIKAKYERFDPDLEMAETARDRIGLGLESDLLPFTRFLATVRGMREYGITQSGEQKYGESRDSYELLTQIHVSF
jgi:hypothetical protein